MVIIKITWAIDHLTDQNKQIKSAKQSREFLLPFRTDKNSQRQDNGKTTQSGNS